ncbi:hypothetical protein HY620_02125 [Candidatus Uhrbacteria bacterium]|nr:hypothetical protein [Candidatus Uhrbacteria bacterium]
MPDLFSLKKDISKITGVLLTIGFSREEAEQQLAEVEEIIAAEIIARLMREMTLPQNGLHTIEDLKTFLETTKDQEKVKTIIREESSRLIKEYFEAVTASLSDVDREQFYKKLEE